jgi:hypothetical protein
MAPAKIRNHLASLLTSHGHTVVGAADNGDEVLAAVWGTGRDVVSRALMEALASRVRAERERSHQLGLAVKRDGERLAQINVQFRKLIRAR